MTDPTTGPSTLDRPADDPNWFRYVLGQYPTGVTLITAKSADGEHVGMVVGTFSSVSLTPPLVSFMPDRKSSSWPKIREAGAFCANIFTAAQQDVCRAFARKQDDRFEASTWSETESGSLRLDGAAAWIDCTIDTVVPAGDHDIVLGSVNELGVGDSADLPLLFLRGGYGSFSIPSIQSLDSFLPRHTRAVDAARPEIESLATDLALECLVSVAVDDTVVVVSAAGVQRSTNGAPSRVGVTFPLAAPLAPIHVAWADEAAERRWLATAAREVNHTVDPEIAHSELVAVRDQGYAVSTGREAAAEFERNVQGTGGTGDADLSAVLPELIAIAQSGGAGGLAGARDVTSLHAPVFGPDGNAELSLTVNGFTGEESPARLQSCLDRLLAAAARITERIGGTPPS